MYGPEIQQLIQQLSKLPGLGPRSGRRLALYLLKKREQILRPLIDSLTTADRLIKSCHICFNLDTLDPCNLCQNPKRNTSQLCVVEDVSDLWAIERSHVFKGRYHVLGGVLSALQGIGPKQLTLDSLFNRIQTNSIQEIILALSATVDGQTTVHYLLERLQSSHLSITTLAQGVPIGSELDYLDDGTLALAFNGRKTL